MKKIVLTYGLISAVLFSGVMALSWSAMNAESSYRGAEYIGFSSMFVALSVIFFAILKHRNNLGGTISFGKAFMVGFWISLIVTLAYVSTWMTMTSIKPEMMDKFFEMQHTHIMAKDLPEAELNAKLADAKEMKVKYVNSAGYRIVATMIEIFPIALLITLISSLILSKKKNPNEQVVLD
ncbi:MAG: DUF4199 domain-containing protein [Bacteroidia bacterium]|nr:DUF4199 domain-containing protein [Bacteroidia bacterium]